MELARPLEQLEHEEAGAVLPFLADDLVERLEPLGGLPLIDVRELVLELVEVHLPGAYRIEPKHVVADRSRSPDWGSLSG
jgi:hypothetical protein